MNFKTLCSNLIAVGEYKAQVTDIKFAAGGSKNVLVLLTITEGVFAKKTHTETISEKAYSFRLMPLLKACKVDVDRDFATAEELFKFGFASAKGKTILIDMGIRNYNGQDYNNVIDFKPLPDSTVSAKEIEDSFGVKPEVKTNIADVVEEEISTPKEPAAGTDEPELDVNLDDIDSPF